MRARQAHHRPYAAPFVCHAPVGERHRLARDSGAAGPYSHRHHGALYQGRRPRHCPHSEPARRAGPAPTEAPEITPDATAHARSGRHCSTARQRLPGSSDAPTPAVACPARHRGLPHGGPRWPPRRMRPLLTHPSRLQLLPQPPLPQVSNAERAQWLEARKADLLPVEYFHVVFTLPPPIAAIAFYNQEVVYNILFRATAETLLSIAGDSRHLGAGIGFFAILHTWGQNLQYHPHLHCVVPGGGLSPDHERWIACRPGFFLPVRVLSRLFRRLFLEALEEAFQQGELQFFGDLEPLQETAAFHACLAPLRDAEWVVYAKPPFGGPQQAIEYLGRYTHRVAISNQRLVSHQDGQVCFRWKDYRHKHKQNSKLMTIDAAEFLRRFLLHTLPPGFQRIRHFGFLANCHRQLKLALCRKLLANPIVDLLPPPGE